MMSMSNRAKALSKKYPKLKFYLVALVIVMVGFFIYWLNFTFDGSLFKDKMENKYAPPEEVHTIEVYAGDALVKTYSGYYTITEEDGHLVLYEHRTHERIDLWGDDLVVNQSVVDTDQE